MLFCIEFFCADDTDPFGFEQFGGFVHFVYFHDDQRFDIGFHYKGIDVFDIDVIVIAQLEDFIQSTRFVRDFCCQDLTDVYGMRPKKVIRNKNVKKRFSNAEIFHEPDLQGKGNL